MIAQVISAFAAIVASSIYLESPKRLIFLTGSIGAIGWGGYLLLVNSFGPFISTFFAGIVISLLSHIFSRVCKTPSTMFFIPGFYPLVPGYRLYMAVYNFILGDRMLASGFFMDTFKISGMIAMAIFTIDTIFNIYNYCKPKDH